MAKYTVTDPTTNKSVDLEGDSPPTEEELNQIFSQVHGTPSQPTQQPLSMPTGKDVLGAAGQALGATPLFGMAKGMEGFQKGMGTINTPFIPVSEAMQQGAQKLFQGSRAAGVGAANMFPEPYSPATP